MNACGGWEAVRLSVRQRIGARAFDAWFRKLDGELEGDALVIHCPDRFVRDWIRGRYGQAVEDAAAPIQKIEYRVGDAAGPMPAVRRVERAAESGPVDVEQPQRLPEQVGFDDFVAGPANALALEAARALSRGELGRCNPLVLAGPAGVGKSHLCDAIRRVSGDQVVVYRSAEEFTQEVTQGIRQDRMANVRQRYRKSANLLILEDLQFLRGKRATQVELFHTLDYLLARGRPVVLTADRPPRDLEGIDAQLASRVASGLVAYIGPPECETRRRILRAKAAAGGVGIPEPCIEALAERPVESVRDLLAGLNQVVARATLLKRPITLALVYEALAAVEVPGRRRGLDEIVALVAQAYTLKPDELRGRSSKRRFSQPRQLAMYLCRRYTDASLKDIGQALGRDHSSVLYAIRAVERRSVEQPRVRFQLEALAARLGS